jgi:hypothetical protein
VPPKEIHALRKSFKETLEEIGVTLASINHKTNYTTTVHYVAVRLKRTSHGHITGKAAIGTLQDPDHCAAQVRAISTLPRRSRDIDLYFSLNNYSQQKGAALLAFL